MYMGSADSINGNGNSLNVQLVFGTDGAVQVDFCGRAPAGASCDEVANLFSLALKKVMALMPEEGVR